MYSSLILNLFILNLVLANITLENYMKKIILGLLALGSVSAFAQLNLDFTSDRGSFQLDFNEGYVCSSEPAFSSAPTLGYGQTKGLAQQNAIINCMKETGNSRMHCDDLECSPISFESDKPSVNLSINNGQIGVRFSTGANYTCFADAAFSDGVFVAEAPTKIEASVYAQRLCMGQTGNARMHCDVESCESLSSVSGSVGSVGISIGGISITGLSIEEKIENLKNEIEILKTKISNPDINNRKKKKLRRKLSRKIERLIDLEAQL